MIPPSGHLAGTPSPAPALSRLRSRPRITPGFTLVELLVVVAIMVILISIGIRAFTSLGKGLPMREAVTEVSDTLSAARQLAITSNANTRFVIITDPALPFRYSTYGVFKNTFITTATGGGFTYLAAQPFQSLPPGVYFNADSAVDDPSNNQEIPVRGQTTKTYRIIEFYSTGNTSTSGEENLLVLGKGSAPGTLLADTIDPDKSTVVVGSSTGRVKVQNK